MSVAPVRDTMSANPRDVHTWVITGTVLLGTLMAVLDASIVNVPGTVGTEPPASASARALATRTEPPSKLAPLAPERFALQVTIGKSPRDKLRYAQELLGHAVPSEISRMCWIAARGKSPGRRGAQKNAAGSRDRALGNNGS